MSRSPVPSSSASLRVRDLSLTFGAQPILSNVDLAVTPGTTLGIVGPNGVGKSTLLKVVAGLVVPDSGAVTVTPPIATIGYLPQEPDRRPGETVTAFLERRTGITEATSELEASSLGLAGDDPDAGDRYALALDRWLGLGGADLDARMGGVLADLGLDQSLLAQETTTLSGGQAARVSLAAILLARFDIFLLDEPTNDLDFDGLARLERFIVDVTSPVLLVSHDRAFLERTTTAILEIDEQKHTAKSFAGGWHAYLDERATARRHAEEAYADFQDARGTLLDRAQRERQWSTVGVKRAKRDTSEKDKNIRHHRTETSENLAAKARQTEQALARLETVEKPWEGWDLRLEIAAAARSGDVVVRLDGAVVHLGSASAGDARDYGPVTVDGDDPGFTLGPVTVQVSFGERIAIVGPNGAGKSTLLAAMLDRVPLAGGARWMGPGVVVGEIEQARARFNGDRKLFDVFTEVSGLTSRHEVRSLLAKFGLGAEHIDRPVGTLSPGERTRATLAVLQAKGVNCLVLDEPTNHLDLPAIEQLEQALERFEGTLLLVSHDRRLLEAVRVDRTLHVDRGQVTDTVA